MLNKITKVIGIGVIIGLNGVNTYGSSHEFGSSLELTQENFFTSKKDLLYECREDYHFIQIKNIDTVQKGYLIRVHNEENNFIGFYLNFPSEIIKACKKKHWAIYDETVIQKLKKITSSEENFHIWCLQQAKVETINHDLLCCYAYILLIANQKNYFIPADLYLYDVLLQIYYQEATFCMIILPNTSVGWYLKHLKG